MINWFSAVWEWTPKSKTHSLSSNVRQKKQKIVEVGTNKHLAWNWFDVLQSFSCDLKWTMSAWKSFKFNHSWIDLSSSSHVEKGKHPMQHSHGGYGYEVGCDWTSSISDRKPVRNYRANHTGGAASSVWVDVLFVLVPVKKFSPTSCYWSVVKWVLLSQQIRLKALAVMEQTCSQPLHSGALCQSKRLLGPYRHFRHHCAPPIHTCRQTCRCPEQIHKWHMHIFFQGSSPDVWLQAVPVLSNNIYCQNKQATRWSPNCQTCQMSSWV